MICITFIENVKKMFDEYNILIKILWIIRLRLIHHKLICQTRSFMSKNFFLFFDFVVELSYVLCIIPVACTSSLLIRRKKPVNNILCKLREKNKMLFDWLDLVSTLSGTQVSVESRSRHGSRENPKKLLRGILHLCGDYFEDTEGMRTTIRHRIRFLYDMCMFVYIRIR